MSLSDLFGRLLAVGHEMTKAEAEMVFDRHFGEFDAWRERFGTDDYVEFSEQCTAEERELVLRASGVLSADLLKRHGALS